MSAAERDSTLRIAKARKVLRSAGPKLLEQGLTVEEVAIAAAYAAFDLAEGHAGHGQAAVEWSRNAIDVIERQIFEGGKRSAEGLPE